MRRLYVVLSLLCITLWGGAQITITNEDIPQVGDELIYFIDTTSFNVGPGLAGANQVWDFRGLNFAVSDTNRFIAPSEAPNNEDFPNANIAIQLAEDAYQFRRNTETATFVEGIIGPDTGAFFFSAVYDPPLREFIFPATYQDTFTSRSSFSFETSDPALPGALVRTEVNLFTKTEIDAYGTLRIDAGDFPVLRSLRADSSVVTLFLVTDTADIEIFSLEGLDTTYQWLTNGSKGALVNMSVFDGFTESITVLDVENLPMGEAPVASFNLQYLGAGVAAFTDNSTNEPTSWLWDFGDGNTSTEQNPRHTYTANGDYTVCLTVSNEFGTDSTCQVISIQESPLAGFTFAIQPLGVVNFEDVSPGAPTAWLWDFGDGNTSTEQDPIHTYTANGTYTVCLTVTNSFDSDSTCQSIIIDASPLAEFSLIDQGNGSFEFTDASSNNPETWLWDFGDGNSSTEQNPTHTYDSSGIFTVCLTASNTFGADSTCAQVESVITTTQELRGLVELQFGPNPSRGTFTVNLLGSFDGRLELTIFNAFGQPLHRSPFHRSVTMATQGWPAGLYYLHLRDERGRQMTESFVVQP